MKNEDVDSITYPLPKRRYHGMLEFSPQRVLSAFSSVALGVVAMLTTLWLLLPIPFTLWLWLRWTDDGFGIDTLIVKRKSRQLRKQGGYYYSPAVRRKQGTWESGLQLVNYRLPIHVRPLTVIRNHRANVEVVYVVINGWKGSVSDDIPDHIRRDIDLNEILTEITGNLVDHVTLFTLRRSADPSRARSYMEDYGEPELTADLSEAIDLVTQSHPDVTYVMAIRCGISHNAETLLSNGQWRSVPAVFGAMETMEYLQSIGIDAEVPDDTTMHVLLRSIFDPVDDMSYDYGTADARAQGEFMEGDLRQLMGPLSQQRQPIPPVAYGDRKWLRVNDSHHTVLVTTKFRKKKVPPGFLDDLLRGLSDWCITSVDIEAVSKEKATVLAKHRRQLAIGNRKLKLEKGSMPTERENVAFQESLERFDDIDMSESDMAYWSLIFVVSAPTPETLEVIYETVRAAAKQYGLALERVTGDAVQLKSFHAALGLL